MPLKERLGENLEDLQSEGIDDLDLAYLKELKNSGISEELLQQFCDIAVDFNKAVKENE